jgi:hypothetical protein
LRRLQVSETQSGGKPERLRCRNCRSHSQQLKTSKAGCLRLQGDFGQRTNDDGLRKSLLIRISRHDYEERFSVSRIAPSYLWDFGLRTSALSLEKLLRVYTKSFHAGQQRSAVDAHTGRSSIFTSNATLGLIEKTNDLLPLFLVIFFSSVS